MSYAVRIALIAALGGFLFGFETAVISGAEQTIEKLWSLTPNQLGLTVASSLFGTVLGSIIAGMPAQRYGRKKVLFVIGLMYLFSAIGCAMSVGLMMFVVFRFIGGVVFIILYYLFNNLLLLGLWISGKNHPIIFGKLDIYGLSTLINRLFRFIYRGSADNRASFPQMCINFTHVKKADAFYKRLCEPAYEN